MVALSRHLPPEPGPARSTFRERRLSTRTSHFSATATCWPSGSLPGCRLYAEASVGQELHRPDWKISVPSAALPRRRTARCAASHKLVGHAEQVPQNIGIDPRQANEYGVTDVVVRHVVNIGVRSEQFGSVFQIQAKHK